ncbi:macrophage migration inhibitory factor-like [Protopterus annectens]|uniref:macrophage migration inhibitory factor-like n=1 Tax=Protopterus annectens TaxID=7888 RepID=UPI001CFB4F17|nr:macrophage migration inhibitory factor-like [Protopterus annectens]
MPMFVVNPNASESAVTDTLFEELTKEMAKAMGKPAQLRWYIASHVNTDQRMWFGGTSDLCALCSLCSIGNIGGTKNKTYSKLLSELLNKHFGISADRIYINFMDMTGVNVGWNGSTF